LPSNKLTALLHAQIDYIRHNINKYDSKYNRTQHGVWARVMFDSDCTEVHEKNLWNRRWQ